MKSLGESLRIVRRVLVILIGVGLLGGATWGLWQWKTSAGDSFRFRTEQVTRGRVAALINASGTVVPEEVVDVGAQVAGKIEEFGEDITTPGKRIDFRSRVEKGTILARIDKSLYEAEVQIAKADYDVATADVKRCQADVEAAQAKLTQAVRDLNRARRGGTSVSPLELDMLTANHDTAKAAVPAADAALEKAKKSVARNKALWDKAKTNFEYTVIRSPVKGVIIDRRVNIGQTVVASLNAPSLFLIATDLTRMQVWSSVNEADIGRIHVGQSAAFRVDAFPTEVFSGVVTQIRLNASMTQNVVTYTVVVTTDNSNLKLLPYLTANLQFRVDEHHNVLLVPNSALRYRPSPDRVSPSHQAAYLESRQKRSANPELKPGKSAATQFGMVWVEEEGYLRPIRLQLGLTDGTQTEVVAVDEEDNLEEGTRLVVGEIQEQTTASSNPFAVKMWSKKKD